MMQTTRPLAVPLAERRPAPPVEPSVPAGHPWRWFLVFVLTASGIVAASLVAAGSLRNGSPQSESPPARQGSGEGAGFAAGIGHVDVESRVINLYPVQPGEVTYIPEGIRENASVKKDDLLFRMDDVQAKLTVETAADALKDAEIKLQQAQTQPAQHEALVRQQEAVLEAMKHEQAKAAALFKKADRMFKSQPPLISKEDRDVADQTLKKADEGVKIEEEKLKALKLQTSQVKFDIDRARVDVSAKKTRLEQAKYALEKCELRAPVDGTVLRMLVSVGDTLGPTPKEPAIIFCPDEPRIIRAEVEQEFASKVHIGQTALIQDDARLTGEWHGKVKRISDWYLPRRSILLEPRQFNDVRTLECIIELDDAKGLKIGQRVRVILGNGKD
jgi:multidrug resistance efflux pump